MPLNSKKFKEEEILLSDEIGNKKSSAPPVIHRLSNLNLTSNILTIPVSINPPLE